MLNVTLEGDCMDDTSKPRSALVFPGQPEFFEVDRGSNNGSFDYDCNGVEEKINDAEAECYVQALGFGGCDVDVVGWMGTVPNCGISGDFIDDNDQCSGWYGSCGPVSSSTTWQVMKCR